MFGQDSVIVELDLVTVIELDVRVFFLLGFSSFRSRSQLNFQKSLAVF